MLYSSEAKIQKIKNHILWERKIIAVLPRSSEVGLSEAWISLCSQDIGIWEQVQYLWQSPFTMPIGVSERKLRSVHSVHSLFSFLLQFLDKAGFMLSWRWRFFIQTLFYGCLHTWMPEASPHSLDVFVRLLWQLLRQFLNSELNPSCYVLANSSPAILKYGLNLA